jgi:hypothetical protein
MKDVMEPDVLNPDVLKPDVLWMYPLSRFFEVNVGKRLRDNLYNDMSNEHESQPGLKARSSLYNLGPIMTKTQAFRLVKS